MNLKRIILSDFTFTIVTLLLGLLSIFSYQRINNLSMQSDLVNHTNLIKFNLEQMLFYIKDAETEQRFYLLTYDSTYLTHYATAIEKTNKTVARIDSLTKDNPLQQHNLRALQLLLASRLQQLNAAMAANGKAPVKIEALLPEGKNLMDQIKFAIAGLIKIEDGLLDERRTDKKYAAYITPLSSLLLSVFTIFIVALAYYILRSETRLRHHAQGNIKKLNDYFKDLPAVFAILNGPNHEPGLVNNLFHEITGYRNLEGKTFREAFPDLAGQGYIELLDGVYQSGQPFTGREMPVTISMGSGELVTGYFNFILQPLFNHQHQTEGILIFAYEITEMIAARQKVETAEQQSRLAIEAANIGTFDWDMENHRFFSSARLLEIFAFSATENDISHQHLINRFHPSDKAIRDKAVENSLTTDRLSYEARIIWPDGSTHWISVYGKIVRNGQQQTLRMYGTVIDITAQKMALEELTESEAKFRLLADSMPQFIWTGDAQGKLDYFNQAVYDYSGLTPASIEQEGWISIVHPHEREENIKKWVNAVTTGEEFIFEHRFRNYNGAYRWQLSRALPQKDNQGKIQRWVGTSTDIDDQKNLSQQLEQQVIERTLELNELNKSLLIRNNIFAQAEENALIGSYSWNLQTGELEYSDNLFRLFGYEPNEFVPSFEKYHSMIHPDDQEQVMKDGMQTMQTKKLAAHTYRIITRDGAIKHFRSTGKIIAEGENIPEPGNVLLIGTVQDISKDSLLNETLRIKNLQLERSNAELESFNYIASHDLQEPLRKIQAFSQRIIQKDAANLSAFSQDYFSRINSSAARMQNLINALLSYSRADANLKSAAPIDLNILIENVKTELHDSLEETNTVIAPAPLPTIQAIGIQAHQLFINLVTNAIKYSKPGVQPHITITAATVAGDEINNAAAEEKVSYWKITVEDNGIGFEQEYEPKIFELFRRLHGNDAYRGTGIGLAICKKIMRNHQGFITANGRPGIGSAFHVYFPVL